MINICTLCDRNYLPKGLAMRQSLIDLKVDFQIYWLCIDDETYDILSKIRSEIEEYTWQLVLFKLSDFEKQDEQLVKAKNNPASKYGSQRDNYIWSLTPYFSNYVLKNFLGAGEYLMYVDSDIDFIQSPKIILDTIDSNGGSIGIHTHRFRSIKRRNADEVGWYNVGVTVFKKDNEGLKISGLWKEWCLDVTNKYYEKFGSCGDQGYLCAFRLETEDKNICVFDDVGNISHLAPWCTHIDPVKPVVFFHFSHFNYDPELTSWSDSNHGEWNPSRFAHTKVYYENYFNKIKQVDKLIS